MKKEKKIPTLNLVVIFIARSKLVLIML